MFSKFFFSFLVISLAALLAAQSAEAVKGPKITHKVYFDIQHGDEKLGRSKSFLLSTRYPFTDSSGCTVTMGLFGGV